MLQPPRHSREFRGQSANLIRVLEAFVSVRGIVTPMTVLPVDRSARVLARALVTASAMIRFPDATVAHCNFKFLSALKLKLLRQIKQGAMLLADRGYDADWIRTLAAERGAWANIPRRCNRNKPICFSPYSIEPGIWSSGSSTGSSTVRVATRYESSGPTTRQLAEPLTHLKSYSSKSQSIADDAN